MGHGVRDIYCYLRRGEVKVEGEQGGKGDKSDEGHGHHHHCRDGYEDNNNRLLVVVKALSMWGGKGKRKTTAYPHGIRVYYAWCMCPPPSS